MRFDLHIHSNFSDGHDDVKTIIKAAVKRGLNGISITDHDTIRGIQIARQFINDLKLDLILIPGVEVTTSKGHLIILGIEGLPKRKISVSGYH